MGALVQVRVDVWGNDGKPHTFLAVTDPDGKTTEYGLVPRDGTPIDEGRIAITGLGTEDGEHDYQIPGDVQSLTEGQYQDLMGYINEAITNPPGYNVLGANTSPGTNANNCTGWAHDALEAAGLSGLDPLGEPSIPSPYAQALLFGIGSLIDSIRNMFQTATVQPSPLILDLDGDGVETTGVMDGMAYFDHAGDGFAEQTGWVGADDGLLVYDRNANGTIDTGAELFGDNTLLADGARAANGFAALAELDGNHDGRIDANDAAFASLRVWKDADSNGYTSDTELLTLADAGVQSINTGYSNSTLVDTNDNAHRQTGTFTRTDGAMATVTDVLHDLQHIGLYTHFLCRP